VTDHAHAPHAHRIVPPDHFPVTWDNPADEELTWTHETEHGQPIVFPYEVEAHRWLGDGMVHAGRLYGGPLVQQRGRLINTYWYSAMEVEHLPPDELARRRARGDALKAERSLNIETLWEKEWRPEVERCLAYWSQVDYTRLDNAALAQHIIGSEQPFRRLWEIHFELVFVLFPIMGQFEDLCRELFGEDEQPIVGRDLLVGEGNASVRGATALWTLSNTAKADPQVLQALDRPTTAAVVDALRQSKTGRQFWQALEQWLDEYGRRIDERREALGASWLEDPTLPLAMLKSYVQAGNRHPEQAWRERREERDRRTKEAMERLANYPAAVRQEFAELLQRARFASRVAEDHNFYLDQKALYWYRQPIIEAGRRFSAAGWLEAPRDVAFLPLDQVIAALSHGEVAPGALAAQAAAARAELDRWAEVEPPPTLGTVYGDPDENSAKAPQVPSGPEDPRVLVGTPASPGTATARARVALSLDDAAALEPGEILVTTTTNPAWSPLFPMLAGLVTAVGSPLSHGAIVAREFGIPAVVAVPDVTGRIATGQWLTLDGSAGQVQITEAP